MKEVEVEDLEKYVFDFKNDSDEVSKDKFNKGDEAFEVFCELYDQAYGEIIIEDNLVTIHTGGWSDNEHLIYQLRNTAWWVKHHIIEMQGGHYYIDTDRYNSDRKHFSVVQI